MCMHSTYMLLVCVCITDVLFKVYCWYFPVINLVVWFIRFTFDAFQ